LKKGQDKIDYFNFLDLSNIISKKIEGKYLFDLIFNSYKNNISCGNIKEIQIFNTKVLSIFEKITKSEIFSFNFNGFENMKKIYDNNLQTLLIYINKNKMLLNHINKNFLRQIEFKFSNQLASDIECYKRSLEELGKYFLLKIKNDNNFISEIKKAILIVFEISQKVKSRVYGLIEKQIKDKKLEQIINKRVNNDINNTSLFVNINNKEDEFNSKILNNNSIQSKLKSNDNEKDISIKKNSYSSSKHHIEVDIKDKVHNFGENNIKSIEKNKESKYVIKSFLNENSDNYLFNENAKKIIQCSNTNKETCTINSKNEYSFKEKRLNSSKGENDTIKKSNSKKNKNNIIKENSQSIYQGIDMEKEKNLIEGKFSHESKNLICDEIKENVNSNNLNPSVLQNSYISKKKNANSNANMSIKIKYKI